MHMHTYRYTYTPIASTDFWQVPLGIQVHVCVSVTLPLGDAFSTNCQKWSFFSRCVCIWHLVAGQLQLFYTNFDSTEKLCYSFGRGISSPVYSWTKRQEEWQWPAASGRSFLGSASLVQLHLWIHEQASAAGSRYFCVDLQWLQNFKDDKGLFFFFFVILLITGLWLFRKSAMTFPC